MTVGIALYGLGTVGGALVQALEARRTELRARHGLSFELRHVVVRDPARPRPQLPPGCRLGTDWRAPLDDPGVALVAEAMGGLEPAGSVVARALEAGKGVATANKALVAARGAELEALAALHGGALRYEAAVAGAIPVLHALRGALVANRIARVRGILNGTTNFILTRMGEDGLSLPEALARARALGFAEADPSADLSGLDAAQKLVILARHAFGRWLPVESVARRGIEHLTAADLAEAARRGGTIRLVAEGVAGDDGVAALRVEPAFLPAGDPLAGVRDEANAVVLEGDFAGPLLFAGRGAGGRATASALLADLVELARLVPAGAGGV